MTATLARVHEALSYDPASGEMHWRVSTGRAPAGAIAGPMLHQHGYRYVRLDRVQFGMHRLVWFYMTGEWPKGEIDHINGDRSDNRWANLRDVTHQTNVQNTQRAPRHNTSGFLGVTWCKRTRRWAAQIQKSGRCVYLGMFAKPEDAHSAYIDAKRRLHEGCTI